MRELAKAVGFSVATVSRALRRDPSVKKETQDAIFAAAQRLGYEINPYAGQLMSCMRRKQGETMKGNLALIWYDGFYQNKPDVRQQIVQQTAVDRAKELGYSLNEFDRRKHSKEGLLRIMRNRGIQGVLISPPSFTNGKIHLNFRLDEFACVSMGWSIYNPAFHRVRFDHFHAIRLAVHHAKRKFDPGIIAILDTRCDRRADGSFRAGFLAHHPGGPVLAKELFFDLKETDRIQKALNRYNPCCLIVQADWQLPDYLHSMVPKENIIYLDDIRHPDCFGSVDSQYNILSRWSVDLLVAALQRNEFGVPEIPMTLLVPPRWISTSENPGGSLKQFL